MLKPLFLFYIFLNCFISLPVFANVQWSSFGTLGITLADSNHLGYRSDISAKDGVFSDDIDLKSLSLLGGQVEINATDSIDFLSQVVLRDLNDADPDDYVTMAFARFTPSANWSIRLGRVTPDLFKITEYRNVNVAYTWADVPNEVYGMLPFNYLDGGDITYKTRLGDGTINYKFFLGQSESIIHANGIDENFKLNDMFGGSIIYDQFDWNIHFRYTNAVIGNQGIAADFIIDQIALVPPPLWPNKDAFMEKLYIKGTTAEYLSLSGQKDWQNWLFNVEIGSIFSDNDITQTVNSGYFSAAYRYGNHTYYGLYAQSSADNYVFDEPIDTSYFPELIHGIDRLMNFYSSNQKTLSAGWRWDINSTITSKFQVNVTDIDAQGATLWVNPNNDFSSRTITSLMYTLSFAL